MSNRKFYEKVNPVAKGFPIKFAKSTGAFPIHWHEYTELLYYLSDGKFFCNGKYFEIAKGEIAIANPTELHSIIEGSYYCLRIAPSFFSDIQISDTCLLNHIPCDSKACEIFDSINREYSNKESGYDMEVKGLVYCLMRYLLKNYISKEKPQAVKVDMVIEALGFIADNYTRRISTSDICNHLHVSKNYFAHTFKSAVGYTPVDYINKHRVEKAAELLLAAGKSITDISATVGIDDPNYFTRLFKKYFNMSPRKYKSLNS